MYHLRSIPKVCWSGLTLILLVLQASSSVSAQTYTITTIQPFQPNGSNNLGVLVGQEGAPIAGIYTARRFLHDG